MLQKSYSLGFRQESLNLLNLIKLFKIQKLIKEQTKSLKLVSTLKS